MIDVFFGESRTYISDALMQKLGWKWGDSIWCRTYDVYRGVYGVWNRSEGRLLSPLRERDGKYCFDLKIPDVRRGRINGARGVEGVVVENGVLAIYVSELLGPSDPESSAPGERYCEAEMRARKLFSTNNA